MCLGLVLGGSWMALGWLLRVSWVGLGCGSWVAHAWEGLFNPTLGSA